MKILVVEPEKAPYEKKIDDDLRAMQEIVDGLIEPIYFEPKNGAFVFCNEEFLLNGSIFCSCLRLAFSVFCNEEFLLNGSEPNRMVGDVLVHGTFFVVGNRKTEYGEEESCSLTDDQLSRYSEEFAEPIQKLQEDYNQDYGVMFFMM